VVGGRLIGRRGSRTVLAVCMATQGLATVPLMFLGDDRAALFVVVPALFVGFFGHVAAIVAITVTTTSGLPNEKQGLATGLTSMTEEVAATVGIPIFGAIAATQALQLTGIHFAQGIRVVVTVASAILIWYRLRAR